MLPTNYDTARLRIDEWTRQAAHDRLVREARAARKASRPEGSGLRAALAQVWAFRPGKHGLTQGAQHLAAQSTQGSAQL